jgi:hypothetical protein
MWSVFFLTGLLLIIPVAAKAQAVCSDSSTPRQCFEAGVAQVGAALADFKKGQSDLLEQLAAIKAEQGKIKNDLELTRQLIPTAKTDLQSEIDKLSAVKPLNPNRTPQTITEDTGRLATEGAKSFPLRCPDGQIAVGIDLTLGGTCHEQCNGDGRPVQQFKLVCQSLQLVR